MNLKRMRIMRIKEKDYIEWYGRGHLDGGHSGRYPWGSGKEEYRGLQPREFYDLFRKYSKQGMTEKQIADEIGISTPMLKAGRAIARSEARAADCSKAMSLKEKGWSTTAIGKEMGLPESTVRGLLKDGQNVKTTIAENTARALTDAVREYGYVDVGGGIHHYMGCNENQLKTAIALAQSEGCKVMYGKVKQAGTGKDTSLKVLVDENTTYQEFAKNQDKIAIPNRYTEDGGFTYHKIAPPISISSSRVDVKFAEDGGTDRDGLIELRPGVKDLSLGKATYAQVRIAVDGTHYVKGMAVYGDPKSFPPGVDVRFNSNKAAAKGKMAALKKMDLDNPEAPFGALIKDQSELKLCQTHYMDSDGKMKQSALNIVNEEGNWAAWSRTLSSQFLSKQPVSLAREQLGKVEKRYRRELDEINSINNPIIKKELLLKLADTIDGSAVHMEGASMPRQATHTILPVPSLKPREIYAPNYKDGEIVVLVRFPHAGRFESPELIVNNKNPEAIRIMGKNPRDAVGINSKTAEQLSGADFDGDTVLVLPNNSGKIKTAKPLPGLVGFDPKAQYHLEPSKTNKEGWHKDPDEKTDTYYPYKIMKKKDKGRYMGDISNLLTDMQLQGATPQELERAVKHSMVVIDAPKHKLNYEQSFKDNGIAALKIKYQGGARKGASTIVSKATSEEHPGDRKITIDPVTGKKIYEYTGKVNVFKNKETGKITERPVTTNSTKMAETDNAWDLVRDKNNKMEAAYANHANNLKALANEARRIAVNIKGNKVDPVAKEKYGSEVASLKEKLVRAEKNAPLERRAQILASEYKKVYRASNPGVSGKDLQKEAGKALVRARKKVGAGKEKIDITPKEWEAIQKHALSDTTIAKILKNADTDKVRQYATPKKVVSVSAAQQAKARRMLQNGATTAEIAEALGISTDNVFKYL